MDTYVEFGNPLTFSVNWSSQAQSLDQSSENRSDDYYWDFSSANTESILSMLTEIDGTVDRTLSKTGKYTWNVDLSETPEASYRFKSVVPYICRSKALESTLFNYQMEGVEWLLDDPLRILADDMGLGKSIQAIAAIEKLIFDEKSSTILLVCPKTLLTNWLKEFEKWGRLLVVSHLSPDLAKNRNELRKHLSNSNVVMVAYPSLERVSNAMSDLGWVFDLVVADEAHKLRNTSQTNRAFSRINRQRTWLLTGTPLERDTDDIRMMLACLDPLGPWASEPNADDIILRSRLTKCSLRRMKQDVLRELPKTQTVVELLSMEETQYQFYQTLMKDMHSAPTGERIGYLSRLCIAAISSGDTSSNKIDRALEICSDAKASGHKVLVFSNFNDALKLMNRRLTHIGVGAQVLIGETERRQRDLIVAQFKSDSETTCLLCNSKIGSEGLTLTEASIVIFLNEWWNPSSNRQAEDRVNRIGQKEPVTFYYLRSKDTIDDHIGSILGNKTHLEKNFLSALLSRV
jgi:SNF2 family DNA or RNA helicase